MSIAAIDMVIKSNNDFVTAQVDGQLQRNEAAIELNKKEAGFFGETVEGEGSWDVSTSVIYQETDGSNLVGADGVVGLDITYNGTTEAAQALNSLSASFETGFNERQGLEDPLWRLLSPTSQAMTLDLSGDYLDPNDPAGQWLDLLLTAQEAGDTIDFDLTFGVLTISGSARPGDWTLDLSEREEDATIDFELMHDGVITLDSGTVATGAEEMISAWFDRQRVSVDIERISGDPTTDDPDDESTYYSGEAYIEEIELSAERADPLEYNFDLAGDGALSRNVFTAE